ncbi:phage major capsid protein [Turicibacter sanguinis]|uniref:phage major capsid protein n=1 Tax=Turicibacter sanguinis TaxID=154288 RepID=UPI0018AAF095|nr:phage major capsid protein [Turicibacter sanguinis]MDB8552162.1 phage major capsid protein [Turicibacter sanguinis]
MKNLDLQDTELRSNIAEILKGSDEEAIAEAFVSLARSVEKNVIKEARSEMQREMSDRATLEARGQAQLTSEERAYYEAVVEKRGFDGIDVVMPKTIFDRVFEDLELNHPLLSKIDFVNTTGSIEWIMRTDDCIGAFWGALTDKITKELSNGFTKENANLYKLSAFIPVSKAMLDLGPVWLDKFVRAMLSESIAIALELAIVDGTGKNQPIGMTKDLKGSVVEGVYPDKEATPLLSFDPTTLGTEVVAPLTRNGKRNVTKVLMIVNPLDYWQKIFGATTVLTTGGTYIHGVLPIPGDIVTSVAVPKGKMVAGMAKDYFMAIGSSAKIEHSDQYRFLEDERTYLTKQYANGKPKDNESFLLFDISNLDTSLNVGLKSVSQGVAAYSTRQSEEDLNQVIAQAVAQGVALALAQANTQIAVEEVEVEKSTRSTKK